MYETMLNGCDKVWLRILLLACSVTWLPRGQTCQFPESVVGTWVSSNLEMVTISTSQLTTTRSVADIQGLTFQCFMDNDTHYVIRTHQPYMIDVPFEDGLSVIRYIYGCLEIEMKGSVTCTTNIRGEGMDDERLVAIPNTTEVTSMAVVCNEKLDVAEFNTLIRAGYAVQASADQSCPPALMGLFRSQECSNVYMTSCGDYSGQRLKIYMTETNSCPDSTFSQLYTTKGLLGCVGSIERPDSDTIYTILYNYDEKLSAATYRFVCLAVTTTTSHVHISSSPQGCQSQQSSTSAPYDGQFFQMKVISTCQT